MESREQVIARLQRTIATVLDPLVGLDPIALVDFPDHSNVGDSAIWLGEIAYLQSKSVAIKYVSTNTNCSFDDINAIIGDMGTIFIHGGGNFGDLWPKQQYFREEIIKRFPLNRIIQLPQTVHFDSPETLARAAKVIDGHERLTLLVRDQRSLDFSRAHFTCVAILCPDMAYYITKLERGKQRQCRDGSLLLLRTDKEACNHPLSALPQQLSTTDCVKPVDWLVEPKGTRSRAKAIAILEWLRQSASSGAYRTLKEIYYNRLALRRFQRGVEMLRSRQHVISDRLHVHIIATLLGIPHTMFDNNYGKIHGYIDTWKTQWDGVEVIRLEKNSAVPPFRAADL
jgi:pyruvyl transferase EpsO